MKQFPPFIPFLSIFVDHNSSRFLSSHFISLHLICSLILYTALLNFPSFHLPSTLLFFPFPFLSSHLLYSLLFYPLPLSNSTLLTAPLLSSIFFLIAATISAEIRRKEDEKNSNINMKFQKLLQKKNYVLIDLNYD